VLQALAQPVVMSIMRTCAHPRQALFYPQELEACAQVRIRAKKSGMTPKKQAKGRSKKPLTITDVARMGGQATAKKLTKEERKESASKAAKARWAKAQK
jgi:hypothetical protein